MPVPTCTCPDEPVESTALRILCRPRFSEEERGWLFACLEAGLDWAGLFELALAHDVAPLAAHRLHENSAELLPGELREGLAIYLEGERLRARALSEELAQLLECLAAGDIPAIPIKGPRLALDLYGDVALRGCRDLDLLLREADVDRTLASLQGLGYRHDAGLSRRQIEAVRRYGGQYILFHPERRPVEPHWAIAPNTLAFALDYDRLWQRARAGDFLGTPCRLLPPEEELLLLCLHGAKEQWQRLKWIGDVAAFLDTHPEIDWPRLYTEAGAQGCARILNLGLALAGNLLEPALPAAASNRLREDSEARRLAAEIAAGFIRGQPAEPNPYRLSRFYWRMRERRSDRWRYAARTLFTPRAVHYGLLNLPETLTGGYYPLKLLWDYLAIPVWRSVKSLRGGGAA